MGGVLIQSAPVKKTNWIAIIIIVIVALTSIAFVASLFLNPSQKTPSISSEELVSGADFNLDVGETIKFALDTQEHTLTVNAVGSSLVTITIQSDKIRLSFRIGQERRLDVNQDGKEDISIKLTSLENGKPYFNIKKIIQLEDNFPEETPADESPPINNQNQEKSCAQKSGVFCIVSDCKGEIVNSLDGPNCCLGECGQKGSCSDKGGVACPEDNICEGMGELATDTNNCCVGTCRPCSIACPSNMKCVQDEFGRTACIFKTCSELSGKLCSSGQNCNVLTQYTDIDGKGNYGDGCCVGTCISSTPSCSPACETGKKCIEGACVQKTCSDIGGVVCTSTQNCIGGSFNTDVSPERCCYNPRSATSCQDNLACTSNTGCEDNNPGTYDHCDKSPYDSEGECAHIPEMSDSFDVDKSLTEAIASSGLDDFCDSSSITKSEDSRNNKPLWPCASFQVWGWCKTWVTECTYQETSKKYQATVYKTPNEDSYKMLAGAYLN